MKQHWGGFRTGVGALLIAAITSPAFAQAGVGEAVAARIQVGSSTPTTVAKAVLTGSDMAESSVESIRDARVTTALATALSTGESAAGVTSVATVGDLNLLGGLVRAANVIAVATSTPAGADAFGSGFEGLVVAGVPIAVGGFVAPNTRIELPGVGYVVLNEQIRDGTAITVNMIRLVKASTLLTPRTEIVIASARSRR